MFDGEGLIYDAEETQALEDSIPVPPVPLDIPELESHRFLFLTGPAGSGKTTVLKHAMKTHPRLGLVSATTGVAAMNADSITINSLLGYGDTEQLANLAKSGRLSNRMFERLRKVDSLILDEVSMLSAEALDLLYSAVLDTDSARAQIDMKPLRFIVIGDFAQLPPIKAKWAFEAQCWDQFKVQRLTKIWRQDNPDFLDALNFAREGNGSMAIKKLLLAGVKFVPMLSDSTLTVFRSNDEVDSWNSTRLARVMKDHGEDSKVYATVRVGYGRTEWRDIKDAVTLCPGCRVRISANDTKFWEYVNGDQGTVVRVAVNAVTVLLDRTNREVTLRSITRYNDIEPEQVRDHEPIRAIYYRSIPLEEGDYFEQPFIGAVTYIPIKLGWASTVHSCQGLTLDTLQVCPSHKYFANPNLVYVALSRVRKPEGLTIHGMPGSLSPKIKLDPQAKAWI